MKRRIFLTVVISLIFLLALSVPVLAGGWAVFTLEELPTNIVAGEPVTIHYTLRQHGVTPLTVEASNVVAFQRESKESISVRAQPGKTGEYTASLTFPVAGVWEWYVDGFGKQAWPDLTVTEASSAASATATASQAAPLNAPVMLSWLGLLAAAAAAIYAVLSRRRWVIGLVVAGVLVSIAGFTGSSLRATAQAKEPAQPASVPSNVELGQALFVAKGCVTCHTNDNIERRYRENSVGIGVNLTDYPTSLEYLRSWLKDPASIKPKTEMPNLNLDEAEIEALAAFILAGDGK